MITDEQVIKALNAYYGIEHVVGARFNLISTMRKALEAYEQSKWVKLSDNDETPQQNRVLVRFNDGYTLADRLTHYGVWNVTQRNKEDATHWQYLPEFKE